MPWARRWPSTTGKEDFVKAVKEATEGRGADVILDMVGGDYIARNIAAAAMHGRIVSIAFLKGSKAEVDFLPMMLKRLTLTGSTLAAAQRCRKGPDRAGAGGEGLAADRRQERSSRRSTRPSRLAEAAQAHALMETSAHVGKIVLVAA